MTLPSINRPHNPEGFKSVFQNACATLRSGPFKLIASPAGQGPAFAAAGLPKKHMRLSVGRHRLKRRIAPLLKPLISQNFCALILLCAPADPEMDLALLKKDLDRLLALALSKTPKTKARPFKI